MPTPIIVSNILPQRISVVREQQHVHSVTQKVVVGCVERIVEKPVYIEREKVVERIVERFVTKEPPQQQRVMVMPSEHDHSFPYQDPDPNVGVGWAGHMMLGGNGGFTDWHGTYGNAGFTDSETSKRGRRFDEFTIDPTAMFS